MDQVARMTACCRQLHQAVFAITGVQMEGSPNQKRCRHNSEEDAHPLLNPDHVENDEEDEHRQQTSGKDEQILRLQSLELHAAPDPLIDCVLHGSQVLVEEERPQNRRSNDQKDTGSEPRRGDLRNIRITRRELVVNLDASDQPDNSSDRIDQLRARVEVRRDHVGRIVDARQPVAALGKS